MELLNTELDAVNLCLRAIGREPVSTVESADLDAEMALDSIQQASIDIQQGLNQNGWWFNRETGWKLGLNGNDEIELPNNTLRILEARCRFHDVGNRLVMRGLRLYDTDDHTFKMTNVLGKDEKVTLTLVLALPFDQLPPSARSAISWTARLLFAQDTVGDNNQYEKDEIRVQRAMNAMEAEERRASRKNYFRDNRKINAQVGFIGGRNNMYPG